MTVTFNHTIVYATDKRHSAEFLATVLGLPKPQAMWSFMTVPLDHISLKRSPVRTDRALHEVLGTLVRRQRVGAQRADHARR